jgi:hypothetical protein
MSGDHRRALETSSGDIGYMDALALASIDRQDEALALLRTREQRPVQHQLIRLFLVSLRALLEGKREESLSTTKQGVAMIRKGGEELFYFVRHLAYIGECEMAIAELERVVEHGFFCYPALLRDPWLDALRSDPRFNATLRRAETRHESARTIFVEAGGMQVLGYL